MFLSLASDLTLISFQDPEDELEGFVGFLCPFSQRGQTEYISSFFLSFYQYGSFNQFVDNGYVDLT